jgi:hypothetical protein
MAEQISIEHREALDRYFRFSRTVVLFLLLAIVMMVGGARSMKVEENGFASYSMIQPLYIGAIIVGFIVVIARRLLLSPLILGSSRVKGVAAVLRTMTILSLVSGAAAVAMGLAGLLVFRETGDYQHSLRLGGVGLLLAIYSLPRRREWHHAVAGLTGGDTQNRREQE